MPRKPKHYWRKVGAKWHCFPNKHVFWDRGPYVSLCASHIIAVRGGQAIRRPQVASRCPKCSRQEMAHHGWDAPGPVTIPKWKEEQY